MFLNQEKISFEYSDADRKLFGPKQINDMESIKKCYSDLFRKIKVKNILPVEATHKEWITSRVHLHANTSIMRLLYLTEAFCQSANSFNSVSIAANIKSMMEIPLHMGYLVWIISKLNNFDAIRKELQKLAFGNRNPVTGLTDKPKVSGRDLSEKTDLIMEEHFDQVGSLFNLLYKDSNAIGHHNFEGRDMLCGLQDDQGTWHAKDRKKHFQFYANNIFQFFLYGDVILSATGTLFNMMEHYLKHLPENFAKNK